MMRGGRAGRRATRGPALLAGCLVCLLSAPAAADPPWDGGTPAYLSLTGGTGVLIWDLFWDGMDTPANIRVGGWGVLGRHVHVGGFVGYRYEHGDYGSPCPDGPFGEPSLEPFPAPYPGGSWTAHALVLGGSGRFGGPVAPSTWLGFGLDAGAVAGYAFRDTQGDRTVSGPAAYLFPAAVLVFLHPVGPVALGVEAQAGVELVVGADADGVVDSCDTSYGAFVFTVGPMFHVGLAIGL